MQACTASGPTSRLPHRRRWRQYTANLAAFFNKPTTKIGGPKSYDELRQSIACVLLSNGSLNNYVPFVRQVIAPPKAEDDFLRYSVLDRQKWCHQALADGRADIMLDIEASLANYLYANNSRNCASMSEASFVQIMPGALAFVFRSADEATAMLLTHVINSITQTPAYTDLKNAYLYTGNSCGAVQDVSDTTPVTFKKMSGLFGISFIFAVLAVVLAAIQRHHHWSGTRGKDRRSLRAHVLSTDSAAANLELISAHASVSKPTSLLASVSQPVETPAMSEAEMLKAVLAKVDALAEAIAAQGSQSAQGQRV
mmetsp:Transcript_26251/g.76721  ORF Transcript_26251/g.76721 Transcript_26251/m.76721 type:complete len:311 (+) Transcript_26251:72-1004(+)